MVMVLTNNIRQKHHNDISILITFVEVNGRTCQSIIRSARRNCQFSKFFCNFDQNDPSDFTCISLWEKITFYVQLLIYKSIETNKAFFELKRINALHILCHIYILSEQLWKILTLIVPINTYFAINLSNLPIYCKKSGDIAQLANI